MLAVFGELGFTSQVGNIATSIYVGLVKTSGEIHRVHTWFSNGETDAFVAAKYLRYDALHKLLLAELDEGRAANAITTNEVPHETATTSTRDFIGKKHLMEEIPLLRRHTLYARLGQVLGVMDPQKTSEVSTLTHLLVDLIRHLSCLFPLGDIRHDLFFHPLSDFVAKRCVGLVEIWGVILLRINFCMPAFQ